MALWSTYPGCDLSCLYDNSERLQLTSMTLSPGRSRYFKMNGCLLFTLVMKCTLTNEYVLKKKRQERKKGRLKLKDAIIPKNHSFFFYILSFDWMVSSFTTDVRSACSGSTAKLNPSLWTAEDNCVCAWKPCNVRYPTQNTSRVLHRQGDNNVPRSVIESFFIPQWNTVKEVVILLPCLLATLRKVGESPQVTPVL